MKDYLWGISKDKYKMLKKYPIQQVNASFFHQEFIRQIPFLLTLPSLKVIVIDDECRDPEKLLELRDAPCIVYFYLMYDYELYTNDDDSDDEMSQDELSKKDSSVIKRQIEYKEQL